jgi:hypothetical protein
MAGEIWALFVVYQAVCQLAGAGLDAAGTQRNRSVPHALTAAADTGTILP